jgi:hypothetical protein
MTIRIISHQGMLEKRRQLTVNERIPYIVNGQTYFAEKKMINGEMEVLTLTRPLGEMLTFGSVEGLKELTGKAVLDVELGREAVPLLYKPLYETISDPTLPATLDAKWALYGTVVFTETLEGQEVKFGSLVVEQGPTAKILTYTAGFEYTKRMKDFNEAFKVDMLNRAIGEAYNALLNHLHFYPIIAATYTGNNATAYQGVADDPRVLRVYKTIKKALQDCATLKRPVSIALFPTALRYDIEEAIRGFTINGTPYPPLAGLDTLIFYDGWTTTVGKETTTYPGVTANYGFFIRPRRGLKELVKQDLRIETGNGDLSRLVEAQIVAYAYRGAYVATTENIQKVSFS